MIADFMAIYEFDIIEFLSQEMMDQAIRGEKALLAYPYMIMYICLAVGVLELLGINEMIEAKRTTNLGLIRDTANLLSR